MISALSVAFTFKVKVWAAPSLSLTIWGAELPTDNERREWDIGSDPDVFVRVSLGGRFLRQSEVKRDDLRPFWALMIGPLAERRFYEGPLIVQVIDQDLWGEEVIEEFQLATPTQDQLGVVREERGSLVRSLVYQWGVVRRDVRRLRRGEGVSDLNRGAAQSDRLGLNSPTPAPDSGTTQGSELIAMRPRESQRARIKDAQRRKAHNVARASRLYKVYLRAQFEGDQLEAHRVLIKLAQQHPYTRHGRKAQRLLLLDGR